MEKLNIAKMLKDCPTGMELDCTMFDNVTFVRVDSSSGRQFPIEIAVSGQRSKYLTKEGCFHDNTFYPEAKCVIFPKGKTTWEGFQRPFKDGDIVAFDNLYKENLQLFIFKDKKEGNICSNCYLMLDGNELDLEEGMYYIKRFATEEEKQKLFDAIKANGYKWNAETKTLEKLIEPKFKVGDKIINKKGNIRLISKIIDDEYHFESGGFILFRDHDYWELVPNKFDISTLNPFDKVLVRDNNNHHWRCNYFSHINKPPFIFTCTDGNWKQCIPYKDNKHLLGTTNDCDDYYKTWE